MCLPGALRNYTRLKARALSALAGPGSGAAVTDDSRSRVSWLLVLEQLIFRTESDPGADGCEHGVVLENGRYGYAEQ